MRKVSKLFLLISLSFLLTFNSCNNVFENTVSSDDEVQTASAQAAKKTPAEESPAAGNTSKSNQPVTIEFGGSLKLKGAVPVEFVEPKEPEPVNQNSRSANAQLPTGDEYEYYVTATSNDGIVKEDVIPVSSVSKDYTLQLEINKTWTFTAGFRKNASGTPGTDSYVAPKDLLIDINTSSGHPYTLTLSETTLQPATQKTFILSPLQTSTGRGTINLNMTAPESGAGITELKLFTSGANGLLQPWQPWAEGESPNLDVSLTQIKTKENMTIASGSYDVTMIFYKHDTSLNKDFQAYISYQTINVFDNMETKVWESGNAPGTESIISGGSFQLTTSLVQKFASSTIYVGAPEGVTVEPDDSRVGSPYAPVKTLNRAFEIIKANTSGDGNTRDYRILVTTAKPTAEKAAQPQKANLEIPAGITSTEAKSIEIIGQGSGANLAVLEPAAGNSAGTILTVNTTVPVTLRNIKLAGGKGSGGNGGAISITKDSAKVTLESGTVISGNSASDQGGGIYIRGTDASHKPKLIIKAGAEIKSNSIDNGGTGGMAIYADCAEVEMTGGEISGNSKAGAQYGAVRLTGAAEFTMTGGSVANNDGGAFYVDSDYDAGTSTYTHSKLKIGGSARIPYGVNGTTGQKKNDVYIVRANQTDPSGGKYSPLEIAGAITVEEGTKIAAITPDGWQRGLDILKTNNGVINDYKDYFITTDPYFILSNQATAQISKLKAPVVVSNNPSKNPSDSNSGTREHPYATLAFALSQLGGGEEDTILIDGLISTPSEEPNGKYEIPASFIVSQCSALTLKGANGLNTDGTPKDGFAVPEEGSGSVLTVDSPVPVKIENLKLTGGNGTRDGNHSYGGGLYLKRGTVTLADGAQITGNSATHGAGILIESNGTLYMYGSSLIGEKKGGNITSAPSVYSQASNYSSAGPGGGIYSYGNVFIGYERWASDTDNTPKLMAEGYGILHNYAGTHGGGIISMGGKFRMASGTIGINHSGSTGGGVCDFSCTDCVFAGGSIEENVAEKGGAIYICSNYITELKNNIEIKNNEATTAGGAVYVAGTLKIQDAVSIPYGVNGSLGAKKNDVYLSTDKTITVSGSFSSSAPVTVATITLPWTRGAQFLQAGDSLTSLPDGIIDKFSFTDAGWDKKRYTKNSTNDAAKIDADIYVAGSNPAKCKTSDGASAPTDTDNTIGNWAHPFASISAATALLDASHSSIIVDGTLGAQTITSTGSLASMTIKGYKASSTGTSAAKLDGGFDSSNNGTTLSVTTSKLVTIEDLEITGGYSTEGGGIKLASNAKLNLASGAAVKGNFATKGGGVYISSSAKLALSYDAVIGNSGAENAPASNTALTTGINKAQYGGGIYNEGYCYLGASVRENGTVDNSAESGGASNFTGGLYANYATMSGGALYIHNTNTVLYSGNVKYNYAVSSGGGAYLPGGYEMTIASATFELNKTSSTGGAIYSEGSLNVKDGANLYASTNAVKINDIYLQPGKTVTVTGTLTKTGTVATITPKNYKRGTEIIYPNASGVTVDNVKDKFELSTDNNGWNRVSKEIDSKNYVAITSPIYVASSTSSDSTRKVCSAAPTSGNTGTKTKPYATIVAALADTDLAYVSNTITIDGTLSAQTIPSGVTLPAGVTAVTLQGYKAEVDTSSAATIKGGGTTHALAINKSATYTIKDLQITNGSYDYGGGIYLIDGTVNLDSGAKVYGNNAKDQGAGVYVASGATLNIKSGSEIYSNSLSGGSNMQGGGIYNNNGNVNIYSGSKIYKNSASTGSGGAIYNVGTLTMSGGTIGGSATDANTAKYGGGISNETGKSLTISGGEISYNSATSDGLSNVVWGGAIANSGTLTISGAATISNNTASQTNSSKGTAYGGGIYNQGSIEITGAITMNGNRVSVSATTSGSSLSRGGAIYNHSAGTLTMTKGTIGSSTSPNTVTGKSVSVMQGGAIYQDGTFNISGSAYVYPGSVTSNDVYLPSEKVVTINSNYTGAGNNGTDKMALTPAVLKRGSSVLGGASCSTTNAGYFMITDSEWSILTESAYKGKLDAQLWVAGTSNTANGVGTPDTGTNGALGTKSKPYSTISEAVNQCWNSNRPFTIYLSGTITGETQTIPAANSTAKTGLASSITIEGFTGNTSDVIDRNLSSMPASGGSALTISTATPVTIKKVKITKGYSAGNGGGINIDGVKGASLTLGEGALITANKAYSNGGGIYIGGTSDGNANLIMNSTATNSPATVSANNASLGGGIYLSYANLCMSGNALIGDTGTSISSVGDNASNSATYGGGVYCVNGSNIYLGCNTSGQTSSGGVSYELGSGYGIRHNYASASGGGVDLHAGSMTIKSGSVSYNSTHYNWDGDRNGGGIWQISGSTITMSGGTIANNHALKGGGVYAGGSFTMTGGTIGDSSSTINSPATNSFDSQSNSASRGGGIYAPSGASVSISGGYINYNYATSSGGGIHWEGSTLSVTDGNISYNYGSSGGAVYFNSNTTFNKATFTKNKGSSGGALYIASGKEVTVSGAAAFTGNTASNGGAIYNDGTFKLTGGATFTSNSASTSGGAVYNYGDFTMSGSASISAGSGAKNNDIGLASGKTITTDGLTTTGVVGLVTPYSYSENGTVITKGSNCSDTQFKVDTGKFILTPESNDYEWYIKNDGTISQGRGANVSNIENVLKNIPENENRYDVHVCGPVSQDDFASIVSAMNQCTGHVLLDLTTATFTGTINTSNLFKNCTKLEEIVFDVNTLPLSSTMFNGCTNLDRLYIQGNVTDWPSGFFNSNNCGDLASIEFTNATSVTIPGTDYISYDNMVIMLPTTLRTLKLGPLDSSVYQYMCGIRYYGTREYFKNYVSVTKTSANIETKAMINCYGESGGPRVYWKGYASGTAGGHFVENTDWDTAY